MTSILTEQDAGHLDMEATPKVSRDLIVDRTSDGQAILLHPLFPRWALTNEVGLRLARSFDGSSSILNVAEGLCKDFPEADPALIRQDALRFAAQLQEANLLESHPQPPAAREKKSEKPPSLTIYVTEQCNLRCKHCAIVEGRMPETTLQLSEILQLIESHTQCYENPTISFLGGEPTLRPDLMEMLEFACSRTARVTMSTNGLLIDEELAGKLAALPLELQVSLDGADPEVHDFIRGKDTFERTWRAIELLAQAGMGPQMTIGTTLTRCAISQVRELISKAEELGIGTVRFLNLNKMRAATSNWDRIAPDNGELKEVLRWLLLDLPQERRSSSTNVRASFPGYVPDPDPNGGAWCPLGKTLIVDSQGETYNCPVLNTSDYRIGNIRDSDFKSMQEGERNQKTRVEMLERRHQIEECKACAWRNFCQGGCQAFSSLRSGDLYVNDEFCDFRRELYRETVRRRAENDDCERKRGSNLSQ